MPKNSKSSEGTPVDWVPTSLRLHPQLKAMLKAKARDRNQPLANYMIWVLMKEVGYKPPVEDEPLPRF